jgi:hypothetical protein
MICKNCGRNIPDDSVKCPLCGADPKNSGENRNGEYDYVKISQLDEEPKKELPMRWYKFLIFISLPMTVINNFVSAFSVLFSPVNKGAAIINDVSVALVKKINTFYGFSLLLLAAVAVYTWMCLFKFKKNALFGLVTLYLLDLIFSLVYLGLTMYAEKIGFDSTVITSFVSAVLASSVMIIANTVYFRKRKSLFIN